jgi:hypothetical protein
MEIDHRLSVRNRSVEGAFARGLGAGPNLPRGREWSTEEQIGYLPLQAGAQTSSPITKQVTRTGEQSSITSTSMSITATLGTQQGPWRHASAGCSSSNGPFLYPPPLRQADCVDPARSLQAAGSPAKTSGNAQSWRRQPSDLLWSHTLATRMTAAEEEAAAAEAAQADVASESGEGSVERPGKDLMYC